MKQDGNRRDSDDVWSFPFGASDYVAHPPNPTLSLQAIKEVTPLDTQIGALTKINVPEILADAMFGPSTSTHGLPLLNTYAVLDAAKIPGLPDLLDDASLKCRCIFKGSAYRELGEVAPWVVCITKGDGFVRSLFTASDLPRDLWNREAGIFIRTQLSLDDLWSHLRHFTRLRDVNGTWYYFRFWEPEVIRSFALHKDVLSDFWNAFMLAGQIVVTDPLLGEALVVTRKTEECSVARPFVLLSPEMKDVLRDQRLRMFSRQVTRDIIQVTGESPGGCYESIHDLVLEGTEKGLRQDAHLRKFVDLCRHADREYPGWRGTEEILRTFSAGHSAPRFLVELEYDLISFARKCKNA